MCLNLLLAAVPWRQERAAWQVSQSQSSVGWLSPLRSPERHVVATSWKWLDFSSQCWPRQPRAQQHRWHTLGFLEAAYGDSVAVHCPPPPVTCTLQPPSTIQLHSIPCLRLIKCVLVLDVTCFIKDVDRKDIG